MVPKVFDPLKFDLSRFYKADLDVFLDLFRKRKLGLGRESSGYGRIKYGRETSSSIS